MFLKKNILVFNFLLALLASVGSIVFSNILGFVPCELCWYQRVFMYPLVVIFATALWSDDRSSSLYSFPVLCLGLIVATYHCLVYYGFISEGIIPCGQGISCSTRQELFGLISIPLLSFFTFATLFVTHKFEKFWRSSL